MKEYGIKNLRVYKSDTKAKKLVKKAIITGLITVSILVLSACNRKMIDTTYGFNNAVITNNGNATVIPINKWRDYKGEAIQIITNDGMAVLTSSYFTSLINGDSANNLAKNYAMSMTDKNGSVAYYFNEDEQDNNFNYQIIDFQYDFDKAIIIQNNHAVVIPVAKWKDYNGEQIQIITPENVVILASNYNTMLVSDYQCERKAIDLAQMVVGENGKVVDFAGDFENGKFNYQLVDLKFAFNCALLTGDDANCILPLDSWTDYTDGEQFQITVPDGLKYVCSSFNTILVNDINGSQITTEKLANALNDKVVNYAEGVNYQKGNFNKQIIDFDYGFQNALINNGTSNVVLPIKKWCDYDGEQLQFILNNGVTILSSSIVSGMGTHSNGDFNIDNIAEGLVQEGNSSNLDPNYSQTGFNKQIFDTKYSYPYALVVNDNSIMILSVDSWRDYAGGEQLQLTLADKTTTFLTTAYDTKLVNLGDSDLTILEVASWFTDGSKNIVDLSSNQKTKGKFNYQIFDTHFHFNYAIATNGDVATVIPITKWIDYDGNKDSDGDYTDYTEQLQITLKDGDEIYSDNTNIKLVYAEDLSIVEQMAYGHLSLNGVVNHLPMENSYKR